MEDLILYLRAGTMSVMFPTESLLLEQCLAHRMGSVNLWRVNKLYLILCTKGKEIWNFLSVLQIIKYMGLPNSGFFKSHSRIIGYFEGVAKTAELRNQNHDGICII